MKGVERHPIKDWQNIKTIRIEKIGTEFWEYFANLKNSIEDVLS